MKKLIILVFAVAMLFGATAYGAEVFLSKQGGEPILDSKFVFKVGDDVLFTTTSGDYYGNKEYYNKKFGLLDQWRNDHTPIKSTGIEYKPHPSAIENGYPKINWDNPHIKKP